MMWHATWLKDGNAWRVAIRTISGPDVGDEAVVVNQHGDCTRVVLEKFLRCYPLPHSDDTLEWVFAWKYPGDVRHNGNATKGMQSLLSVIKSYKSDYTQ